MSDDLDVVTVGAGLAGLYMLYRIREQGLRVQVLEAGDDIGGTWYWNRYPGARCDVESYDYSYSFSPELQQEWVWTERFPSQPEVLAYINHVADRFDLRRDIRFGTRVVSAVFDERTNRWTVETQDGDQLTARFCVMATGCLSIPKDPEFPGLGTFEGGLYQTARWPHDSPDFTGQRVACIGTGSSGIQCIPMLARQALRLHVFQRTPNFSVPAQNRPLDSETDRAMKLRYPEYRQAARASYAGVTIPSTGLSVFAVTPQEREQEYTARWQRGGVQFLGAFVDIRTDPAANDTAAEFIRDQIRQTVVDPVVAAKLLPNSYPVGTKRLCVDSNYFATYNRANVTLVDLREDPIEAITPCGIQTSETDYEFDSIVLATGFDAMTGALMKIDMRGRGGARLQDEWSEGPRMYLGLAVAQFPNLFTVTGPGSPSVLSNMVLAIEQHVDWIAECIGHLVDEGISTIEATATAQEEWAQHVSDVADLSLFPKTDSWYVGTNVPGKPRVLMPYLGGFDTYAKRCDEVAAGGYVGFRLEQ
jgi:cyclohexanone monooxygenase